MSNLKRLYNPESSYFITCITKDRFPYFNNPILCKLFIEELRTAKLIKGFKIYGFCIMVDHFHLLLKSSEESNVSKDIQYIKKHFSRNANQILGFTEIYTPR